MNFFKNSAFSLAEVVVAVGIFAFSIVGIVGFIGAMGKQNTEVRDADDAARVVGVIQDELQRWVDENNGSFQGIDGKMFYATQKSGIVGEASAIPQGARFFQIDLERNKNISPAANDNSAGFLELIMTLQWPVHLPNGQVVSENERSVLLIPVAVHR